MSNELFKTLLERVWKMNCSTSEKLLKIEGVCENLIKKGVEISIDNFKVEVVDRPNVKGKSQDTSSSDDMKKIEIINAIPKVLAGTLVMKPSSGVEPLTSSLPWMRSAC